VLIFSAGGLIHATPRWSDLEISREKSQTAAQRVAVRTDGRTDDNNDSFSPRETTETAANDRLCDHELIVSSGGARYRSDDLPICNPQFR